MQPSATDLIRRLSPILKRLSVRWYVLVRQTGDVDVTVEEPPEGLPRLVEALPRLVEALRAGGFRLRIEKDVDAFVARTRVLPLVDEESGFALDIVLAGPGLDPLPALEEILSGLPGAR